MKDNSLSIVIPIGPRELSWKNLLTNLENILRDDSLSSFSSKINVILSYCEEEKNTFSRSLEAYKEKSCLRITSVGSKRGRSFQLNRGAQEACGDFLWFLHADSQLERSDFVKLCESLRDDPEALHYFTLIFLGDGPFLTCLNEWGARMRSEALHMPFGDQGFCLKRETFWSLKGFLPWGSIRWRRSPFCLEGSKAWFESEIQVGI